MYSLYLYRHTHTIEQQSKLNEQDVTTWDGKPRSFRELPRHWRLRTCVAARASAHAKSGVLLIGLVESINEATQALFTCAHLHE